MTKVRTWATMQNRTPTVEVSDRHVCNCVCVLAGTCHRQPSVRGRFDFRLWSSAVARWIRSTIAHQYGAHDSDAIAFASCHHGMFGGLLAWNCGCRLSRLVSQSTRRSVCDRCVERGWAGGYVGGGTRFPSWFCRAERRGTSGCRWLVVGGIRRIRDRFRGAR